MIALLMGFLFYFASFREKSLKDNGFNNEERVFIVKHYLKKYRLFCTRRISFLMVVDVPNKISIHHLIVKFEETGPVC